MDPGRIHSYLQAACAGLGFDIGEVWFAAVDKKNSKLTSIGKYQVLSPLGDLTHGRDALHQFAKNNTITLTRTSLVV